MAGRNIIQRFRPAMPNRMYMNGPQVHQMGKTLSLFHVRAHLEKTVLNRINVPEHGESSLFFPFYPITAFEPFFSSFVTE